MRSGAETSACVLLSGMVQRVLRRERKGVNDNNSGALDNTFEHIEFSHGYILDISQQHPSR